VRIGVVPDPQGWDRWEEAKAYLEPARARGDFETVWEPDELLWAVLDGNELLACATAWLSTDGFAEVKLVGGRDHHRWLKPLDGEIGRSAREAGASRLIAWGRAGWIKSLGALGWEASKMADGAVAYSRELRD
jgi:hypothetical protein